MKHESDWVDVNDDALMVKLGIRHPSAAPRDPSVWTKSPKEKALLKRLRNSKAGVLARGGSREKYEPLIKYTLNITIAKNDKFMQFDKRLKRKVHKTTFSHRCYKKEIPFILNRYVNEEGKSLVKSYSVRA
jgi:hypothetical protein